VEDLEDLIAALEDEGERAALINRLRLLLEARQPEAGPLTPAEATGEALRKISEAVGEVSNDFIAAAAGLEALPGLRDWLGQQLEDPDRKRLWRQVLSSLAATLGLGYAAFLVARLALARARRRTAAEAPARRWSRLGPLLLLALLDLLPIGAFAVAAYLSLAAVDPAPVTRLVALAWINAILLVRLVDVAARLVFAPNAPGLRLPGLDDRSARAGRAWVGWLAALGIYGWFGIRAAVFAGLSQPLEDALLRVLGLLLTLLGAALVLRLRRPVAGWIGDDGGDGGVSVRARLARLWHLPALLYLTLLYGIWALRIENGFGAMALEHPAHPAGHRRRRRDQPCRGPRPVERP
jgi:moderate conductance mechanosensitive channel